MDDNNHLDKLVNDLTDHHTAAPIPISTTTEHIIDEAQVNALNTVESYPPSPSELALSQLCSSCRFERAVVICSVCNEMSSKDKFATEPEPEFEPEPNPA